MQHVNHSLLGIEFDDLKLTDDGRFVPASPKASLARRFVIILSFGLFFALGFILLLADSEALTEIVFSPRIVAALGLANASYSVSNLMLVLGLIIVATTMSILYVSIRHFYSRPRYWSTSCPHCDRQGVELLRIHRRLTHRILGRILRLPIRNYHCDACRWEGMRVARSLFG